MDPFVLTDNGFTFLRGTEMIRVTACGENAVRFEAFPGGEAFDENFTL